MAVAISATAGRLCGDQQIAPLGQSAGLLAGRKLLKEVLLAKQLPGFYSYTCVVSGTLVTKQKVD